MKRLIKTLTLVGVAAWSLTLSPTLQARTETNFNFNTSSSTNGWVFWLPDAFELGDYTVGLDLPSVTFVTNNMSANNMALRLHSGTTNSTMGNFTIYENYAQPRVGAFFTNAPALQNFTMTGEIMHWTNGQGQAFGLAGRVALPLPDIAQPGTPTVGMTPYPFLLTLEFRNHGSANLFWEGSTNHATDSLRIALSTPLDTNPDTPITLGGVGDFAGPTNVGYNPPGRSWAPNSTSGHYRLIFTANGIDLTGQIVDVSTGIPMTFGGSVPGLDGYWNTNIDRTVAYANVNGYTAYLTNGATMYFNGSPVGTVTMGGAYGFYATVGDGVTFPSQLENGQWDPTKGQPIDPTVDNFAIVPGVVTLESAAAVNGPYTQDTTAGIEVNPKRITVPANGNARYYRINWIGCDHTPTITGVTLGGPVTVTTGVAYMTVITNVVNTVVLTYN